MFPLPLSLHHATLTFLGLGTGPFCNIFMRELAIDEFCHGLLLIACSLFDGVLSFQMVALSVPLLHMTMYMPQT